jgi:hypothetical protein
MAASPDPKQLQEIKKLLDEIAKGYDTLRQKNPFDKFDSKGLQDVDQTINQLRDALDGVNARVEDFTESVSESYNAFKSIVSELGKVNSGLNESRKSYSAAASLAQKIRDHELGISNLSSKQLKQIKDKVASNQQNLKSATNLLEEEKNSLLNGRAANLLVGEELSLYNQLTDQIQKNNSNLNKNNDTYTKLNSQIDTAITKEKQLEKQLGVTGGVLKGIAKIPILGDLFDSNEALEKMEDTIRKGGSSTEALSAGFKNIGSQIKGQLLNPANLVLGAITQLISALVSTDTAAGDMAKQMNMTYSDALATREQLTGMANASYDTAVNTKGLQESYMAIGKSLGSNAMASEATLKTFTKLREQAGYTNEQLTELNKLSLVNGKSLEDNTKEILGGAKAYASRKGLVINEKDILNDVVNASASLKLSLGGSADALAKSAVQARSVGINLEQAAAMADQLLNFESSIENELSAELLLGKDLNFERARALALNNDVAGAAEEIAKQVGSSADFANMNAIQQEAIAKAAGMTKDQLAQSLMDREALAKLSGVEGKDAKEKFDNLVKQVGMEEAKRRLGNEQLSNQFEQQSVQEKFNQTVEKLKEIFMNVANALMPIFDIFSSIFNIVGPIVGLIGQMVSFMSPILKPLLLIYGAFKGIQFVNKGLVALNSLIITQNKLKLAQNTAQVATEGTKLTLGQSILATLGLQNAARAYSLVQATTGNTLTAIMAAMQQTILGSLILQGVNLLKNVGQYVYLTLQSGYRAVAESTILGSLIAQGGAIIKNIAKGAIFLAQAIATSIAQISGSAALSFGAAALIALAAGAAAYAFFNSIKGDDVMSPGTGGGGYGSRTLFGPEGAIQLNNKDTVIAGTNLFDKADDMMSAPKGALQVSNSTTPKKEVPVDTSAATNSRLDALISLTGKVNSVSTLRIQ